ncbi:basic region leucine zipper [Diaporthe helianthi]|uniref:Basic region leucine zipper n=1 Tax=Diaporthe helianthi TaxID=158607 RepID=A0A2P5HP72_DIAHE|nr:basic region leucine zipper [Diaporthe helianthi]
MANYGRQGSNLAQFMREQLNTVPTSEPEEDFTSLDNLELFTNAQFFDFDSQTQTDFKPTAESPPSSKPEPTSAASTIPGEFGSMEFSMNNGEFNFGDFNNAYASPTLTNFPDSLGSLQPIQPNPQAVYPAQHAYANHAGSQPKTGDKRRAAEPQAANRAMNMEEVSRVAAEEDKRRRNTAASARFRVKKKQREQALEKSAKEMSEKVAALEQKITQLETENQWLKKLVIEKNEGSASNKAPSQATIDSKKEDKVEAEIIAKTDGAPEAKKNKTEISS